MPTLPAHPSLDQLRHRAKELLRAAKAGDVDALREIRRVSDAVTLAAAQLAVARSYGFASWPKLKAEVAARELDLGAKAYAFCQASIDGRIEQAARLLRSTPGIAGAGFATAVVLGDAARVRDELRRDPGLATRRDARSGFAPLHAASASRWHHLEPGRADGLLAVVRLLLGAGADPTAPRAGTGWSPLRCAIASANSGPSNRAVVELLLARGAVPTDHDLYLAGFAHDRHELLPLLLVHVPDVSAIAEQALAAPISGDDVEATRTLLDAGADPRRYRDDDGVTRPIVWAAVRAGCSTPLLDQLLVHDADADRAGPDGSTPYRLATAAGRTDLCELLRRHGADEQVAPTDSFLSACLRADRADARRRLQADPGLLARLDDGERAALVRAAEAGNTEAVALMLDLGFPSDARGELGATALHAAAHSGSASTVRLLLDRGADIEARDTTWNSTPLVWATFGSGERPDADPAADWTATARILIDRGASTHDVALSPDDAIQPSPEVALLLRRPAGEQSGTDSAIRRVEQEPS
jgi:ankyrin repeat protein